MPQADRASYARLLEGVVSELLRTVTQKEAELIAEALYASHQLGGLELDCPKGGAR